MNHNALLLDALEAFAADAPRNPDGTLTEQAKADLAKIAAVADHPEMLEGLGEGEGQSGE